MTTLYVHFPWCVRKCPYCDFNSHESMGPDDEPRYIDQLIQDLNSELQHHPLDQPVSAVFFGGGTPSLMSAQSVARLLETLATLNVIDQQSEITLEANPGTAEQARFAGYRAAGVNRMSLGIQSLDDNMLKALGRIHDHAEALRAVATARQAGFDNINLDLMFGLPEQTMEMGLRDLQSALDLDPEHLSWYQLTLEPNTRFYSKPPTLPVADLVADLQDQGHTMLAAAGFAQYETSAYAKQGRQCQHNLNYWRFGDYLGIGAGAHGKLTDKQGRISRTTKTRVPGDYLNRTNRRETSVDQASLPVEFLMNALRLIDGFEPELYQRTTGQPLTQLSEFLLQAQAKGLLEVTSKRIKPTDLGARHLNYLLTLI